MATGGAQEAGALRDGWRCRPPSPSGKRKKRSAQRLQEFQEKKREGLQKYIDDHAKSGENGPKAAAQRKSRMKKMTRLGVEAAGEGKKYKLSYDAPAEEVDEAEAQRLRLAEAHLEAERLVVARGQRGQLVVCQTN